MRKPTRSAFAFGLCAVAAATGAWFVATPSVTADATSVADDKLIATVDVFSLLEGGLVTPERESERQAESDRLEARTQALQDRLAQIEAQAGAMDQNSPQFAQLFQMYQQIQQQLQQANNANRTAIDAMIARQANEVYLEIRDAIDALAEAQGYTYVLTSASDRSLGEGDDLPGYFTVSQRVLGRPLLHGATGHDLTEAVRDELGYPHPDEYRKAAEAKAAADAAAADEDAADNDSDAETDTDESGDNTGG